ncbi:MAG TPA: hypothetical protein VEF05_06375 [Terriglobales bacterium]|nr:hypothetical protein [Terriglobales bacterium]
MSVSALRRFVCWGMLAITPTSLIAADEAAAVVYCKGTVWLNGNPLPDSSAILSGDMVQTTKDSTATITASGSSVIVQPESVVKFASSTVSLEQGSISVGTSNALVTSTVMATVTPASDTWTEYEVTDVNGVVDVLARKGNLSVNCGKETAAISDGMEVIGDASGKCTRRRRNGAYPPADGDILNSPYLKYVGAAAAGGTLIWLLWPHPKQPVSASQP